MVVMPRLSIDTFPELTPPVLVVGTQAPGLGPKDVEKTITWRVEKYVSATPGVDHVESQSRNGLSVVYVWFKWGTDLNSGPDPRPAAGDLRHGRRAQVPGGPAALRPPVRPLQRPGGAGRRLRRRPHRAPALRLRPQQHRADPGRHPGRGQRGGERRHGPRRSMWWWTRRRPRAGASPPSDVADAVHQSNALLPSGEFLSPDFDANVYTNAVPTKVDTIGEAAVKVVNGRPVLIRDVAQVVDAGAPDTQAVNVNGQNGVYLNVLRTPGGNTLQIVDAVKAAVGRLTGLPPGTQGGAHLRPVHLRALQLPRPQEGDHPGPGPHRRSSSCSSCRASAGRSSSPWPSRCPSPSPSSCSTPRATP